MELFPQFVWPTKINAGSSEKSAVTSFLSFAVYSNSARGMLKSKWMSPIVSVSSRSRCSGEVGGELAWVSSAARSASRGFVDSLLTISSKYLMVSLCMFSSVALLLLKSSNTSLSGMAEIENERAPKAPKRFIEYVMWQSGAQLPFWERQDVYINSSWKDWNDGMDSREKNSGSIYNGLIVYLWLSF